MRGAFIWAGALAIENFHQIVVLFGVILFGASYKDVSTTKLTEKYDWRARLRPKEGGKEDFYSAVVDGNYQKDHLLRPIQESNGMVWQYTPTIFVSATANYNAQDGQGTNYPINVYMNSTPPEIPVAADWTANDIYDVVTNNKIFRGIKNK